MRQTTTTDRPAKYPAPDRRKQEQDRPADDREAVGTGDDDLAEDDLEELDDEDELEEEDDET